MRPIGLSLLLLSLQMMFGAAAGAQPSLRFAELEHRLLDSNDISLDFQVSATGAIQVNIAGSLRRTASGDIALLASGVFAGQDVDLIAVKNGQIFEYGKRSAPTTSGPPDALWEALVIGFTRMGILHNIANLTADAMPDHADGGVADWVLATNIENDDQAFAFDIIVSGMPSGSATLFFDDLGNPLLRRQTVAFPGGEMHVVETYSDITKSE